MKRSLIILLISIISSISFGQIKSITVDLDTKEKIPFVNIWDENENIGTTSNEEGAFVLNNSKRTQYIIFSAPGYMTKKIEFKLIKNIVELTPQIIELNEVVIRNSKKHNKEILTGKLKKSKIKHYRPDFARNPRMYARYFEYKKEYKEAPLLKKIQIATETNYKDSKFNIRLFNKNKKGEPGEYIYDNNIIGIAKQGRRITEIDILNRNIEFPKDGIFVAIQWLRIEENKRQFDSFAPYIGFIPLETNANNWSYIHGKWTKSSKNSSSALKYYKNKYNQLAVQLVLSN